jgi:uridine phosphorylase
MSNHARGLWGYSGLTPAGHELTIQATGMGGPSATVVLADLAELGVSRAVRLGTCASLGGLGLGEPLIVTGAYTPAGGKSLPDPELAAGLANELEAMEGIVVSLDSLHRPEAELPSMAAEAADMQTAALLRAAREQGVAAAALLIATEKSDSGQLQDERLEQAVKRAGHAASALLSP